MREVRMTFGEHLEELRRRLIHSILYLAVALVATFAFGEELMEITLAPHRKAIAAAHHKRLASRLQKHAQILTDLRQSAATVRVDGEELRPEDVQWEVLFARDVALPHLVEDLQQPFGEAAELLSQSQSYNAQQKTELSAILQALGGSLSQRIAAEFAPGLDRGPMTDALTRFGQLRGMLREIERDAGASEVQAALGLGSNLTEVTGPLDEFITFLEARKVEAAETDLRLEDLKERLNNSRLPAFLDRVVTKMEVDALKSRDEDAHALIVLHYMENFMAYLKVALIFGLGFSLPLILYEMWKFVGAGLYENEQAYVVIFLPFSLALFIGGVLFGFYAMIPVGLQFLAGWGVQDVNLSFSLGNYIGLFFTLTLIMGLVFQVPLIMVFLSKIDVVRVDGFRRARKVAIFLGFCGAAIITPPDPFTLLMMAGPLVLLYELGIIVSQILTARARKAEAEDANDGS